MTAATRAPAATLAALACLLAGSGAARADAWRVDPERSTFAVLTHRAGVAARLAHDHLVVARGAECALELDPAAPETAALACRQAVLALDADPEVERARLAPRLARLGAVSGALPPVDDGDRAKIRREMLDARQLFAERFPEIRVELVALAPRAGEAGGAPGVSAWDARWRMTLRGQTVEAAAPVRLELAGETLTAELLAELRFTAFGIEPYSAVLGTVRNADLFHLYVELVAHREAP